ncbi:MAG: hypothetical protein ABIH82_02160 [Candidatus Woesearchaeota archaeon]
MVLQEVPQEAIEKGKEQVAEILSSLSSSEGNRYISTDDPRVIGAGNQAVVIALEPIAVDIRTIYLVAKLPRFKSLSNSGRHTLAICYERNPGQLEDIIKRLKVMGFNNIPFHHEVQLVDGYNSTDKIGKLSPYYYDLSLDLREGGKYDVYEMDCLPFKTLRNGKELFEEYLSALKKLHVKTDFTGQCTINRFAFSKYWVGTASGHENVLEAARHIFLARVDKEMEGQLLIGDLDHISLGKTEIGSHFYGTVLTRAGELYRALRVPDLAKVPDPFKM